jgi:DNA-binding transcriptional MerR regulator
MVAANRDLLKVGQLAKASGVSIATIKFYLREGLLPRPTLKTSRNMAWYDRSFIERIRAIKRMQERFLPLRVIKQLLADRPHMTAEEAQLVSDLTPVFSATAVHSGKPMAEREALRLFPRATRAQLELLASMGLLTPQTRRGRRFYDADDVRLLDALARSQDAGFSIELFPLEDLGHYVQLLGELAEREVRLFARNVSGRISRAEARRLVESALPASEPVLVLLRRKLLLRAAEKLLQERRTS